MGDLLRRVERALGSIPGHNPKPLRPRSNPRKPRDPQKLLARALDVYNTVRRELHAARDAWEADPTPEKLGTLIQDRARSLRSIIALQRAEERAGLPIGSTFPPSFK